MSGVTLWFDPEGRVSKVGLHGAAGALYSGPLSILGPNWIPSDQPLLFGLTAHSSGRDFARVLGAPVSEIEASSSSKCEVRRVWRKRGYVIDATFLGSDRTDGGKMFQNGALVWVEVSRGL
jgi:hypothetical protein